MENKLNRTFAIASLQLGILGVALTLVILAFMIFAPIVVILALIFGIMALNRIKKEPKKYGGKKMAWAGIILSILSIILMAWMAISFAIYGV